jgi:hypothetical protein
MDVVETQTTIECTICHHLNEAGMLFCINCGNGLTKNAERVRTKTIAIGFKCPQCNKTDDLNVRFCVFCGHRLNSHSQSGLLQLASIVPPERRKTAAFASFERAVNQKNLLDLSARVSTAFNYAAGILLATLLVIAIYRQMPQSATTSHDLLVYTDHPNAQLSLSQSVIASSQPPSSNSSSWIGRADSQGKFSFGSMPQGNYVLRISAPGCRTVVAQIGIDREHKVLIGSAQAPIHIPGRVKE